MLLCHNVKLLAYYILVLCFRLRYLHISLLSSVLPQQSDSLRDRFPPYANNGALVKLTKLVWCTLDETLIPRVHLDHVKKKYLLGTKT